MDLQKVSAAKLWLISAPPNPAASDGPRSLPYLAHALYALVPVESSVVPSMTCDTSWRIYVNPGWLDTTSVPDVGRELAHVIWHLLSDHAARAHEQGVDSLTAAAWSRATDASIAQTLDANELVPTTLPTARRQGLPSGRSAEEYFALLSLLPAGGESSPGRPARQDNDVAKGCGSGADGVRRSHELPEDVDAEGLTRADAEQIRNRVAIDFIEHAGVRGDTSGGALRWAQHILEPTIAWQPILAGAVRRAIGWAAGRGDYTYRRPSRRSSSVSGIVLPGQQRPIPRISIVIDTSASVDDRLLERALGEIDGALLGLGVAGSQVTVYSVDAAAHRGQRVRRARDAVLTGAGGTDMRLGLAAASVERPRPDLIMVLTDGDTPWPQSPPTGSAVVIALLGRQGDTLPPTPRWAVRVECRIDGWRRGR